MKRIGKKILCLVLSIGMMMATVVTAHADEDTNNITVAHGAYSITQTDDTVTVKAEPAKGYVLSKLYLKNGKGDAIIFKQTDPLEYQTSIKNDIADYKVVCNYRQATMINSANEIAMKTGESNRFFKAHIEYVEGSVKTRDKVIHRGVKYTSSNPNVVNVDEKTGRLEALQPGYARITATAEDGNGVESFGYVIVDGDKITDTNHKVGTIQLYVYFGFEDLIEKSDVGHSILIFRAKEQTTIKTKGLFKCYEFSDEYYEAVKNYDDKGVSPVTYKAIERKPDESDEDYSKRCYEKADELIIKMEEAPETFTILPGEIATFGNVSGEGSSDMLGGDFYNLLERHDLADIDITNLDLDALKNGTIDIKDLLELLCELSYDLKKGYNPFNGGYTEGTVSSGMSLNFEAYRQLAYRDMSSNVCITTDITQIQLDAMMDFVQYKNHFNILGRNCTEAAVNAWNIIAASSPKLKVSFDCGGITKGFALPLCTQIDIAKKVFYVCDDEAKIEFNAAPFYGQKLGAN